MTTSANDTTTGATFDAGTGAGGSGGNTTGAGDGGSGSPPTSGQGGSGGTSPFASVQDASLRQWAEGKGWKGLDDVLKSGKEAETLISQRPQAPKLVADPKEYTFKAPDNAKDIGYSDEFAGWYRNAAFKSKMPADTAAALHDEFVGYAAAAGQAAAKAHQDALQKSIKDSAGALEAAWGAEGTPTYKRNMELAQRSVRMADKGLMDELRAVGALTQIEGKDYVTKPALFKLLAQMGEGMYSEDTPENGGDGNGVNPFADETQDMAMQGRLMKTDPDRAELLIKAAGKQQFFSGFLSKRGK